MMNNKMLIGHALDPITKDAEHHETIKYYAVKGLAPILKLKSNNHPSEVQNKFKLMGCSTLIILKKVIFSRPLFQQSNK